MENRERDRVSQRTTSTEAGELNRHVEEEKGRERNSGTSAEFGQNIGRSENLEGGTMNNNRNDKDKLNNANTDREQSRRDIGSDYSSSTDRSSSVGNMGGGSDIDRSSSRKPRESEGEVGTSKSSGSFGDSSEGRH
ncbi:MAG TPA: hypothetical protein VF787_08430 [Thermoanaerobaculia bacterium]